MASQKDDNVYRTCSRKTKFNSKAYAKKSRRWMRSQADCKDAGELIIYKCKFCYGFHIGHR